MKNTKLIKILKTFSKSEANRFIDFVNSPFFNKNVNLIKLSEEVFKYYPDFESEKFTEENIFKEMFKTEKYNYYKMKNFISDLLQLALMYLRQSVVMSEESEIELLNELHNRKLDANYDQREKKLVQSLQGKKKDENYYHLKYLLAKVNTSHYKFEKTGYTFNHIQNELNTFIDYSLTGLLRLYSKMLHNKNHGNVGFELNMFDDVWNYAKDNKFENNPSCKIYRQIILLELNREEKDYLELLKLKHEYSEVIPEEDIYYILLVINSFAVYKLKSGDESFYKIRFDSLREIFERNFFDKNSTLYVNFISTFSSACMAGEYEWAEDFLNNYLTGIIPAEEKINTAYYCRGFLAYRKKEYDKALEFFSKTNFKLFLLKVMVKSYSIRIFYEHEMHEQTISAIDSFRHYLKSEKMMEDEQKQPHYEFLRLVSELTKLKLQNKKKYDGSLMIIRDQIKNMQSNPLGIKNWLTEKSGEFFN